MGHIRVDLPNTNNKWVGFRLVNVDTFIIRVGFGLTNVDTIRTLTRHEHDQLTQISTPNLRRYVRETVRGAEAAPVVERITASTELPPEPRPTINYILGCSIDD